MAERIHIVIAEPSVIIRSGIIFILKRMTSLNIDIAEIYDITNLPIQLNLLKPNILIINPLYLAIYSSAQIKGYNGCEDLKIIALESTLTDKSMLQGYDDTISIYDSTDTIKEKIYRFIQDSKKTNNTQKLSLREKEIIVCVVEGMTNKQIADALYLSTHTIITHRRNIANKLQIHSPAGLTIYAIVNKLVDINDVKKSIPSDK